MNRGGSNILVRHAGRFGRLMATLVVLPALVLSPLAAQAILIHNHHGDDLHVHAVTLGGSMDEHGGWQCEHQTPRPTAALPNEDCSTIVLVLGLPDVFVRGRGLTTGTVVAAPPAFTPRAVVATADQDRGNPSPHAHPWAFALESPAGGTIARILLCNHALLL